MSEFGDLFDDRNGFRAGGVETMNPITQRLPIHAADLGRLVLPC
ncbi:hypothetical protein [Methylocystis sp.]